MSDAEIIERVLRGETDVFALIVERYGERVLRLITRLVNNGDEAEDLAQDALVQAFGQLGRFRGESSFASWLYRIAYNTALQRLRKKHVPTVVLNDEVTEDVDDAAVDAFFASEKESRIELLRAAIDSLPPADRAIIELFYYDNASTSEIGVTMGMTEGAVRSKLYRIRHRLYEVIR